MDHHLALMFWVRAAVNALRTGMYAYLAWLFWRFRKRSEWKAICTALVLVFGIGSWVMGVRVVAMFSPQDDWLTVGDTCLSIVTGVAVYSIARSVRR